MSRFVYIVDDDISVRTSLYQLLTTRSNLLVKAFSSGDSFLEEIAKLDAGVVLLDLNMPGLSGTDVLPKLHLGYPAFGSIVVTGHGDVKTAVQAMKLGAIDFIEKPYSPHTLFRAIDDCIARLEETDLSKSISKVSEGKLAKLSNREIEILLHLVDGKANKSIARILSVSPRTVEGHRANIMQKLDIDSLPEAVRLVHSAGLG